MITNPVLPQEGLFNLGTLIGNLIGVAIIAAGILTLLYLLWGGLQWILSSGEKAELEQAKSRIFHAIIGLTLVAATWAIMTLLVNFFGLPGPGIIIPRLGGGGGGTGTGGTTVSGCPGQGGLTCDVGTLSVGPCTLHMPRENCCLCQGDGSWIAIVRSSADCYVRPGQCH